jgi:hypothetical protein
MRFLCTYICILFIHLFRWTETLVFLYKAIVYSTYNYSVFHNETYWNENGLENHYQKNEMPGGGGHFGVKTLEMIVGKLPKRTLKNTKVPTFSI